LNKGDNAYLPSVIETPITDPDKGIFGFYLELAKSKGSTKTGVFWINVLLFVKAKCLRYLG
jgi:hypothetical protein